MCACSQRCVSCQAALFCNRECQLKDWKAHKNECSVIATFRKTEATQAPEQCVLADNWRLLGTYFSLRWLTDVVMFCRVLTLLDTLSWSAVATKSSAVPKVVGVAKSLGMDETSLPGWFFAVDYELVRRTRSFVHRKEFVALTWLLLTHGRSPRRTRRHYTRLRSRSTVCSETRNAGAALELCVTASIAHMHLTTQGARQGELPSLELHAHRGTHSPEG